MPTTPLGSALAYLQAELVAVDRQLAQYKVLRDRRERLVAAIQAVESVDKNGSGSGEPRAVSDFAQTVQRSLLNHLAQQESPVSPSDAAYLVLRDAGHDLHIREIVGLMHARGWYTDREYESLRGSIAATLDAKVKQHDTYFKPMAATYGLLEWMTAVTPKREDTTQTE